MNQHGTPGPRWWDEAGMLRDRLLRLDGRVGEVVAAEQHLVYPVVVPGALARQLERAANQMGLDLASRAVEQSDSGRGPEHAKGSFSRVAGSLRRPDSPREPGM